MSSSIIIAFYGVLHSLLQHCTHTCFSLLPFYPNNEGVGGFGETAFFHKETKTLLVTDTIIRVDDEPPAIIQEDPRSLIYHSRDRMSDIVDDTPENRRKGLRRMVLFGLFFQPAGINIT